LPAVVADEGVEFERLAAAGHGTVDLIRHSPGQIDGLQLAPRLSQYFCSSGKIFSLMIRRSSHISLKVELTKTGMSCFPVAWL